MKQESNSARQRIDYNYAQYNIEEWQKEDDIEDDVEDDYKNFLIEMFNRQEKNTKKLIDLEKRIYLLEKNNNCCIIC